MQSSGEARGVILTSSANGWMNDELTADWLRLRTVIGKLSFRKQILVSDAISSTVRRKKEELRKGYNISTAVIPGGCTKYIQAPDVSWNKPFKQHLCTQYDDWLANGDKEFTKGGNIKAPPLKTLVEWVKTAWSLLSSDLIKRSFAVCALTTATDGSENDQITCFREACPNGLEQLKQKELELGVDVTAISDDDNTDMQLDMDVEEIEEDNENDFAIDSSDDE